MERRDFFKILTGLGAIGFGVTKMSQLNTQKMPALFIGHGSPMNALADSKFTQHLAHLGKTLPRPKKILMISAHWMTRGVELQASENPKTIHDFYGFPQELFQMQYPAPGNPELAKLIVEDNKAYTPALDLEWGLDHGAWSVLCHMYPKADIPVVGLSLNQNFLNMSDHYKFAQELEKLRHQGVLIVGSGNIVHNLRALKQPINTSPLEWAEEFDEMIKKAILERDLSTLFAEDKSKHSMWKMSHPSLEHYLPLLYVMGASKEGENITFPYEAFEYGSLSMRSVLIS